jgi:hypothetical protein
MQPLLFDSKQHRIKEESQRLLVRTLNEYVINESIEQKYNIFPMLRSEIQFTLNKSIGLSSPNRVEYQLINAYQTLHLPMIMFGLGRLQK